MYTSRRGRIGSFSLLVIAGMAGCATAAGGLAPNGFIVAGASAPAMIGAASGDTLREVSPARVPLSVVRAADSAAVAITFDPRCSRFFGVGSRWLIRLRTMCFDSPRIQPRGGARFILADQDGRVLRRLGEPAGLYSVIQPNAGPPRREPKPRRQR